MLKADKPMAAPAWAIAERQLLDIHGKIAEQWQRAFLLDDGTTDVEFIHGGGVQAPDDFFECITSLPLLYALGAPDPTLNAYWKAWKGSLKQCTQQGLFANEMVKYLDWHHNGEHYQGFWLLGLCIPENSEYRRLSLKYASFYDGTNPAVPNYDPQFKVIRSMNSGGAGPVMNARIDHWVEGNVDEKTRQFWSQWLDCAHDGPLNLVTTCFGTNAFLLTGDAGYKQRTMDYIDAWRDRAKANGGIVPSIVRLDGTVPAEWWGGVLGWDFTPFGGLFQVSSGPRAACGNALLLTGDTSYYDEMRCEADEVWAHRFDSKVPGVKGIDVPRYRGKDGWYGELYNGLQGGANAAGIYASLLANLYLATMSDQDLQRILDRPVQGGNGHSGWEYEPDWARYLIGRNPGWPEKVLTDALTSAKAQLAALEKQPDCGKATQRTSAMGCGAAGRLFNCMTGGIMPLWHGQLPLARFRYFDPERRRPGITEDCAALVEAMTGDSATLVLVNTSLDKSHEILVQTGAYGEHQCVSVQVEGGETVPIGDSLFAVKLAPGAGGRYVVKMKRYANTPTAGLPWSR